MDTFFAAVPAAAAVSFLAIREAWRAWQPTRHLLAGDYEAARASAEALSASWMRVIPGIRVSAQYAVAASLHLMGDLEGSLAITETADRTRLRPATRYDFDSLEAATLTLLDREPGRVLSLLRTRARSRRPAEDVVLEALARLTTPPVVDGEAPDAIVAEARTRAPRGERAVVFRYLCGLYELRVGRTADAEKDLRQAADAPHANIYTRRSRAYLEPRTPVEDGPSSLAPHVVAKAVD